MQTHKIHIKAYLFDCNESIFIGFEQAARAEMTVTKMGLGFGVTLAKH